jgi:predicted ester cyclase
MSLEQNKAIVLQFYEAVDRYNIKQAKAIIAPNIVARGIGTGILDYDGFFEYGFMMHVAFPDGYHIFEDVIAEGNKVVTCGTFTGTHQGDIMGIPPTKKLVTFSVVHVDFVVDSKIVEHWGQGDAIALMQQLGVLPAIKPH